MSWKGARPGRIAEALLKSPTASPIILLDEFEKAPQLDRIERPYDIFHTLLEEENSEDFVDDFLELRLRADHIIWIGSANDTAPLPSSILSRMLVLAIPSPDRDQVLAIIDNIYATIRDRYGDQFAATMSDAVRDLLARYTPRRVKRAIAIALGFAAAEGRDRLCVEDARRAIDRGEMPSHPGSFRHPVGFRVR